MRSSDLTHDKFGYTGYLLSKGSRRELRNLYPEKYRQFVGHHITHEFGVKESEATIPDDANVNIVGYADSGDGLEAFVAEVNGSIYRPDGNIYHLTWSFDPNSGYKPVDSNALVKKGYEKVDPINIHVTPKFFEKRT